MSATGTQRGEFMGSPASGKRATWEEIHIIRMQDGKAVEHWGIVDALGTMQQLGMVPAPGQQAQAA